MDLRHEDRLQKSQDGVTFFKEKAHNPVCWNHHTAFVVRLCEFKVHRKFQKYTRRQNRENMEPKKLQWWVFCNSYTLQGL